MTPPHLDLPGTLPEIVSEDLGPLPLAPEHLFPRLDPQPHEALLLSGGDHPLSRYSYIGLDPFLAVFATERRASLVRLPEQVSRDLDMDPFDLLRDLLDLYRKEPPKGAPRFWGGGIGYFSYELGRLIEKLPGSAVSDLGLPELYFVFYRSVLACSHRDQNYRLYEVRLEGETERGAGPVREGTRERILRSADRGPVTAGRCPSTRPLALQSLFSREEYLERIRRALHHIVEGDIYQVNLSQRFHTPYNGDPYGLFLKLFEINPAPFFAFLDAGSFQVLSSSPERFLCVQGAEVETRPIKGTLPRGATVKADRANRKQLMRSEKNRAELAMITDLLRNDLGRICEYGSVHVREAARLEAYANVFHLVSVVTGRLPPGKGCIDLLRAAFPGGSITGCPKIRSMEIIDELERTARSVYTGSIGYLGWDGTMDLNIAIRSFLVKGEDLYFQVGGGIVYDSDPLLEYEETLHKAASMKEALEKTCRPEA
jgi:para-aminobenzoate synthetase component I